MAIAALLLAVYGPGVHPGSDATYVRASMEAGARWVVHEEAGAVVGCICSAPVAWTGTREICSFAVHTAHHGASIGRSLSTAIREATLASGCDIGVCRLRQQAAKGHATAMGFRVTGHDGGQAMPEGTPEAHLVSTLVNAGAGVRRAALTAGNPCDAVVRYLPWDEAPQQVRAAAPAGLVVAPQGPPPVATHADPGVCTVPAVDATGRGAALSAVRRWLEGRDGARHVTAHVPAEHVAFAADLGRLGFRPTAYLPLWYAEGGVRHDCLHLVRTRGAAMTCLGTERDVAAWNRLLAGIVATAR